MRVSCGTRRIGHTKNNPRRARASARTPRHSLLLQGGSAHFQEAQGRPAARGLSLLPWRSLRSPTRTKEARCAYLSLVKAARRRVQNWSTSLHWEYAARSTTRSNNARWGARAALRALSPWAFLRG